MGDIWKLYEARNNAKGKTLRDTRIQREAGYITRKLPSSLPYQTVEIDGEERQIAIISGDDHNAKTICTMPGEDILAGTLITWDGMHWLVISRDPSDEIYTRATIAQCNYLLRWIAADGNIIERWSIISDGTKYLTGETVSSYNDNGMALGDTRVMMTLGRDEYSVQLNRSNRFLIDDYESNNVLAYRLTKPFKLGSVYNGHGVLAFVLTEVNTEDTDNFELHIANYYEHFPREGEAGDTPDTPDTEPGDDTGGGKKVWL